MQGYEPKLEKNTLLLTKQHKFNYQQPLCIWFLYIP